MLFHNIPDFHKEIFVMTVQKTPVKIPVKKWVQYIILSICLAAVVTWNYTPEIRQESDYPFINALLWLFYSLNGYGLLSTIAALAILALLIKTDQHRKQKQRKLPGLGIFLAILFGFGNVCGLWMYYDDIIPFGRGIKLFCTGIFQAIGYAVLFAIAEYWILFLFDHMMEHPEKPHNRFRFAAEHPYITGYIIIMVCWLPWILAYYPASADNDVFWQLDTVTGYLPRSNHHPYFASLVLGWFVLLGHHLGSDNLGLFLFVFIRDLLMAGIYVLAAKLIRQAKLPKALYWAAIFFYAVTPVWGAYAKHAFKDTFGAAIFCLYIITLIVLIRRIHEGQDSLRYYIYNGAAGCFAALMRNNFIYCIVPAVILLIPFFIKHKTRIYKAVTLMVLISVYFMFNFYIFNFGDVARGSKMEARSIPLQQMARTIRDHQDELSSEEIQELGEFVTADQAAVYDPLVSDPVKSNMPENASEYSDAEFYRVWLKYFTRYPVSYVEAGIGLSSGYYAITPKRDYDAGNWNSNMCIWDWLGANAVPSDNFHFSYTQSTEFLRQLLDKWGDLWGQIPLLSITYTIAVYTWLILILGLWVFKKKFRSYLIPVTSMILLILTCMASPVNDCFRYYAPAAASFPALLSLLGFAWNGDNKN